MEKTMNNQELTGEETVLQDPQSVEQNNVETCRAEIKTVAGVTISPPE